MKKMEIIGVKEIAQWAGDSACHAGGLDSIPYFTWFFKHSQE